MTQAADNFVYAALDIGLLNSSQTKLTLVTLLIWVFWYSYHGWSCKLLNNDNSQTHLFNIYRQFANNNILYYIIM